MSRFLSGDIQKPVILLEAWPIDGYPQEPVILSESAIGGRVEGSAVAFQRIFATLEAGS
jgi:hypothetical protein